MITVAITIGFDQQQVIGFAHIDETRLPPVPGYHLALAYTVTDISRESPYPVNGYRLEQLGIVPDTNPRGTTR